MHQIEPHPLWVGHAGDGRAARELMDRGIQAIVQLAIEEPPIHPSRELILCRIPLLDGAGNNPALLALAAQTVATLVKCDYSTLVCCGGGMSRAPAIAAAAFSFVTHSTMEDCLRNVAEHQPADVSPGLWDEVCRAVAQRHG